MGYIQEKYIIEAQGNSGDLEVFINSESHLFVGDEHGYMWFTMDLQEWERFKNFVDEKFKPF